MGKGDFMDFAFYAGSLAGTIGGWLTLINLILLFGFMRMLYFNAIFISIIVILVAYLDDSSINLIEFFVWQFIPILILFLFAESIYRVIFKKWFFKDKEYNSYLKSDSKRRVIIYTILWNINLVFWTLLLIFINIALLSEFKNLGGFFVQAMPVTIIFLINFLSHRYVMGSWLKFDMIKNDN